MLDAELERRNQQSPDWGVFVDAYVDEGLSAKNTNRPAFQRMMADAEIGRIDTVMFTELSRLSRSLKDFLNIFEFAQKHQCDLVCLKTDIDTTSPYKSLITKILMIFAEFEREMTSRRTAANAYERSKRGLANGGAAPLGYRRDGKRKGHFVVDPTASKIVRALFAAYLKEQSIKRAAEHVRARYPDYKLSRSKLEMFVRCPRCFYLDRKLGIGQVSMPAFTLNNAVDLLLKKEFDRYRAREEPHPLMRTFGVEAVPMRHPQLDDWRNNRIGVQGLDGESNMLLYGAVDDLWLNVDGETHVVDYKATSIDGTVTRRCLSGISCVAPERKRRM